VGHILENWKYDKHPEIKLAEKTDRKTHYDIKTSTSQSKHMRRPQLTGINSATVWNIWQHLHLKDVNRERERQLEACWVAGCVHSLHGTHTEHTHLGAPRPSSTLNTASKRHYLRHSPGGWSMTANPVVQLYTQHWEYCWQHCSVLSLLVLV